jgi:hypothetical protein
LQHIVRNVLLLAAYLYSPAMILLAAEVSSTTNTSSIAYFRAAADFNEDGISDISVYSPRSGIWRTITATNTWTAQFGFSGTLPISGDFDGDGQRDLGCYNPKRSTWYLQKSREGFFTATFGNRDSIPVVGDFDGDGRDDFGSYSPLNGRWQILKSTNGIISIQFGYPGTVPVVGDFDGDRISDIACYDLNKGLWFFKKSRDGFSIAQFGYKNTVPLVGDFDADGRDDIGCYDNQTGRWFLRQSRNGLGARQFGFSGIRPIVGDFDEDGRCDIGCYYPPRGAWFIMRSEGGLFTTQLGQTGDIPLFPTAQAPTRPHFTSLHPKSFSAYVSWGDSNVVTTETNGMYGAYVSSNYEIVDQSGFYGFSGIAQATSLTQKAIVQMTALHINQPFYTNQRSGGSVTMSGRFVAHGSAQGIGIVHFHLNLVVLKIGVGLNINHTKALQLNEVELDLNNIITIGTPSDAYYLENYSTSHSVEFGRPFNVSLALHADTNGSNGDPFIDGTVAFELYELRAE